MRTIRNFSIANRLAFAFGFAILMLVVQSAIGYMTAGMSISLLQTTVSDSRANYDLAIQVRELLQSEELHLRRMSVLVDRDSIEREAASVSDDDGKLQGALNSFSNQSISSSDLATVHEIAQVQRTSAPARSEVVALSKGMQTDQANTIFDKQLDPVAAHLRTLAGSLADSQKARLNGSFARIDGMATRTRLLAVVSAVFGGIAASVAGVVLYRSIARPLAEGVRVADHIARGDLTLEIHSDETNELGTMMRSMGAMSRKMREAIAHIGDASRSIHSASSEIADGNFDLSTRTERQALAIQSATNSIDAVSSNIRKNAESSHEAKQQANEAADIATQGGIRVGRLATTMEAISGSSNRIADIVSVIDGIAFQTNILALNAAVEAARAGDQGRGFAVVASEVRTLAQRSSVAAREIRALIHSNVNAVTSGVDEVTDAAAAMQAIVASSNKVATAIAEISNANASQAHSIVNVHAAMNELDEGVRQNAALVEEASAASESLKLQTIHLNEAIQQFVV